MIAFRSKFVESSNETNETTVAYLNETTLNSGNETTENPTTTKLIFTTTTSKILYEINFL